MFGLDINSKYFPVDECGKLEDIALKYGYTTVKVPMTQAGRLPIEVWNKVVELSKITGRKEFYFHIVKQPTTMVVTSVNTGMTGYVWSFDSYRIDCITDSQNNDIDVFCYDERGR